MPNPPSILPLIQQTTEPYAFYRAMRRDHPVTYDGMGMLGIWSVFRYDEAREALVDHAVFSSDPKKGKRPVFGSLPQRPTLDRGITCRP